MSVSARSIEHTGWTIWGSNPSGGEIFRIRPDRPWSPPSLLYSGYRAFLGDKAAGTWRWPPTPSSAEVKERVELYLYYFCGPSWPVLGWTSCHHALRQALGHWTFRCTLVRWEEALMANRFIQFLSGSQLLQWWTKNQFWNLLCPPLYGPHQPRCDSDVAE